MPVPVFTVLDGSGIDPLMGCGCVPVCVCVWGGGGGELLSNWIL